MRSRLRAPIALLSLALAGGLALVALPTAHAAPGPEDQSFTFQATPDTLGVVPDKVAMGCGFPGGTQKVIDIPVTGLAGPLSDVEVTATITVGWVADLTLVLIAPDGSSAVLVSRTGNTGANTCGDSSTLAGSYTFSDQAVSNWWSAALAAPGISAVPAGTYRSSNDTPPGTPTLITPQFTGLADPNGTWILRALDSGVTDIITVSAASLSLTVNAKPILDVSGTPDGDVVVDAAPSYTMSSTDFDLDHFECSLDGAAFANCGNPYQPSTDVHGDHVVEMRAVDSAGQLSAVVTRHFTHNTQACIDAGTAVADASAAVDAATVAAADAEAALADAKTVQAAAQKAVVVAKAKLAKATKKLTKAKSRLAAAKKSGNPVKIKAAKAAVKKASKAQKAAKVQLSKAQSALSQATAAVTTREGEAATAQQALADAQETLAKAVADQQAACAP